MAGIPKLTPEQWDDVVRRVAMGENQAAIAREFSVSPMAVSKRCKGRVNPIKQTAEIVDHQFRRAVEATGVNDRDVGTAAMLTCRMIQVSENLSAAALANSITARKMAEVASSQAGLIDTDNPESSADRFQMIAAAVKISNEAALVPLKSVEVINGITDATEKQKTESNPTLIVIESIDDD